MNASAYRLAGAAAALALAAASVGASPPQRKSVFLASPPYPVDLSLTMTGKCAPVEGSDFKHLDNPDDPMTPKNLVPVAWLEFSTRVSVLEQELAWEHPGLSKMGVSDYSFVFSVTLDAGQGPVFLVRPSLFRSRRGGDVDGDVHAVARTIGRDGSSEARRAP